MFSFLRRQRFRKRTVKQALEHLICYLGTVPAEFFPEIDNFDTDSESDSEIVGTLRLPVSSL